MEKILMKYRDINKFDWLFYIIIVALVLVFAFSARAQKPSETSSEIIASGGAFTLEKAVLAGGGNAMQGQAFTLGGTTGQAAAGVRSTGGNFSLYSGFWTPDDFAVTAANSNITGRILTADGRGIRNVRVTLTSATGEVRTALSSSMGYYHFADVPSGETYILSVKAKTYTFSQSTKLVQLLDDLHDADFIANDSGF